MSFNCITSFTIVFTLITLLTIARPARLMKSDTLTPQSKQENGAHILHHFEEVNITNNEQWRIITNSQQTWQFIIILDNSWGFNPYFPSSINLQINSPTRANTNTFTDLLFGFTTNDNIYTDHNNEYLSMFIPFGGGKNKIYPYCSEPNSTPSVLATGNIAAAPALNRLCDISGGECTGWNNMKPELVQETINFPITITATGDPESNTFYLTFSSATSDVQTCSFTNFPVNQGFKIYIGANENGQQFLIDSFDIKYSLLVPTSSPTYGPTTSPIPDPMQTTYVPRLIPTYVPTLTPTSIPTKIPTTLLPTLTPTLIPSYTPTMSPTLLPTINTLSPTLSTNTPSNNPTLIPTTNPTEQKMGCGDSKRGFFRGGEIMFPLNIPYNIDKITINTCAAFTDFNTTLTLFEYNTMEQIAFDSDGCNDMIGRSQIMLSNVNAGDYNLLLKSPKTYDIEGLFHVWISCALPQALLDFCSLNMF